MTKVSSLPPRSQWHMTNRTLLQGCEPGYSLVGNSCFLYVGAPMTYEEAKAFCKKDNASLPFLQKYYWEVQVSAWLERCSWKCSGVQGSRPTTSNM